MKNLIFWLCLGCIPLYGFWILPEWGEMNADKKVLETLVTQTAANTERLRTLKQAQQSFAQSDTLDPLDQIPVQLRQDIIMLDLQKIVEESSFSFSNMMMIRNFIISICRICIST